MMEANARIIIDRLLRESDWVLSGDDDVVNVDTEMQNQAGFADYVLKDSSDFPLCIIEAKKELVSPLVGKEQALHSTTEMFGETIQQLFFPFNETTRALKTNPIQWQ